ncbi:PREDICTED: uncharacterized protein LOC108557677 [Nicrophorus vespilloides]|uniref:Glycosyltransferase family 92 protein n=1 Tax=Nicrophorus vespilloides TaxID=110193 RepID=A0ABM1M5D4_NICVS|nr:PREDICTED: uncharacterized protein LOC108557677 [Nicrophorus vespilloides]
MRKYKQLLLVLLSIVSLSLLLLYRHEYNKLHTVLEVFNFFGQPCNLTDLLESNRVVNHYDWGPNPIWTEDENIQVFSSFWSSNEVKSIVAVSDKVNHARSCFLWYEDQDVPVVSKMRLTQIQKDEDAATSVYFYLCSTTDKRVPYAVSYSKNNKRNLKKHLIKSDRISVNFSTTVCVPPSNDMNKRKFSEFLSFHNLIGIQTFIVYTDLPYRFTKFIENFSSRLNINITFYQWNFGNDLSTLSSTIVENDCLLRTMNQSRHVITLKVNEYLVPYTHLHLDQVLTDFPSDQLKVAVQKFCLNYENPQQPIALQNLQSVQEEKTESKVIYRNIVKKSTDVVSTQGIEKASVSIHRYEYCKEGVEKMSYDDSIKRFETDFMRATLVQQIMRKQL